MAEPDLSSLSDAELERLLAEQEAQGVAPTTDVETLSDEELDRMLAESEAIPDALRRPVIQPAGREEIDPANAPFLAGGPEYTAFAPQDVVYPGAEYVLPPPTGADARRAFEVGIPMAAGALGPPGLLAQAGIAAAASPVSSAISELVDPSSSIRQAVSRGVSNLASNELGVGLGAGVGAVGRAVAGPVKRFAQNQGSRALGFMQSQLRRSGRDEARRVAQVALDEGVLGPLASAEKMVERAENVQAKAGKILGDLRAKIDKLSPGADVRPILEKVRSELDDFLPNTSEAPQLRAHLEETLNDIAAHADPSTGKITATLMARLKKQLAERAFSNALQVPETLGGRLAPRTETARGAVQGAEEALAESALPADEAAQFGRAKDVYGAMERLTNPTAGATEARAIRDMSGNQVFTLPGMAGMVKGDTPLESGVLAAAVRLMHQKGNQINAVGFDRLAKLAESPLVEPSTRAAAQLLLAHPELQEQLRARLEGLGQ